MDTPVKTCVDCGIPKPKTEFYHHRAVCIPCYNAQSSAYHAAHAEHYHDIYLRRYADPVERQRIKANHKAYLKTPNGKASLKRQWERHQAALRHAEGHLTQRQRRQFIREHPTCLRCGATEDLTTDHVIPVTLGGPDTYANLQVLCRPCNTWKGQQIIDYRAGIPIELPLRLEPTSVTRAV